MSIECKKVTLKRKKKSNNKIIEIINFIKIVIFYKNTNYIKIMCH